jgi:hypothetical protein
MTPGPRRRGRVRRPRTGSGTCSAMEDSGGPSRARKGRRPSKPPGCASRRGEFVYALLPAESPTSRGGIARLSKPGRLLGGLALRSLSLPIRVGEFARGDRFERRYSVAMSRENVEIVRGALDGWNDVTGLPSPTWASPRRSSIGKKVARFRMCPRTPMAQLRLSMPSNGLPIRGTRLAWTRSSSSRLRMVHSRLRMVDS